MKDISIRDYQCLKCGEKMERDINASIEEITEITKERISNI